MRLVSSITVPLRFHGWISLFVIATLSTASRQFGCSISALLLWLWLTPPPPSLHSSVDSLACFHFPSCSLIFGERHRAMHFLSSCFEKWFWEGVDKYIWSVGFIYPHISFFCFEKPFSLSITIILPEENSVHITILALWVKKKKAISPLSNPLRNVSNRMLQKFYKTTYMLPVAI